MKQKTGAPTANRTGTSVQRTSARRSLTLMLSPAALEALKDGGGVDPALSARFELALRVYLGDRDAERPAWAYPVFLRGGEPGADVELELNVDGGLWELLEAEALRQQVPARRLAEHAVLYFAAELAGGRLTQRILDDLEQDEAAAVEGLSP
jgi:hypothetical protein